MSGRGPWIEALDVQADLIERLLRPGSGLQRVTEAFDSTFEEHDRIKAAWQAPDGTVRPLTLSEWQAASLVHADTYWVSAEMLEVTRHAAESLDLAEPLTGEDLPVPAGFAFLERSEHAWDVRGRLTTFRAIGWTQIPPMVIPGTDNVRDAGGVVFTLWVDTHDPDDEVNAELAHLASRINGGRYQIMHVGQMPYGENLDEWCRTARQRDIETDKEGRTPLPEAERVALGMHQAAWMRTFWRLIEQRVGHQVEAKADRATARRVARVTPRLGDAVTVVTLRRYNDATQPAIEGEREVSWSHRWIVRGHWRNQWYASLGRHRQIWIAPFVKGPDDQPLVLKPKVHRWTR